MASSYEADLKDEIDRDLSLISTSVQESCQGNALSEMTV